MSSYLTPRKLPSYVDDAPELLSKHPLVAYPPHHHKFDQYHIHNLTNRVAWLETDDELDLINQQIAYIPLLEKDQVECRVFNYLTSGDRHILNPTYQACFRLKYLKFRRMIPRTELQWTDNTWPLKELVDNNIIYPIMVFMNGFFVPWEYIKVVVTQTVQHIIIDIGEDELTQPQILKNAIINLDYIQIVTLPITYKYYTSEDKDFSTDDFKPIRFIFTEDFKLANDINLIKYMFKDSSHYSTKCYFKRWVADHSDVNAFEIYDDKTVKLTDANVLLWSDGIFASGERKPISLGTSNNTKDKETGELNDCMTITPTELDAEQNPTIRFDSTLITIGDGTNTEHEYQILLFVNTEHTKTVDNINRVAIPGMLQGEVEKYNADPDSTPQYLKDLRVPFRLRMNRDKLYTDNLREAVNTIMKYNASLLNNWYLQRENLVIEEHTGYWLKSVANGTVAILSRHHESMIEEQFMLFVNGLTYKYNKLIRHTDNKVYIPVKDINDDDVIEILRFQHINNYEFDITVSKDADYQYYSPWIINTAMRLFSTEQHLNYFDFSASEGIEHFPVEYTIEQDPSGSGKIKIILTDEFYYDKPLHAVYVNRFKMFSYTLENDGEYQEYKVDMGTEFMYCDDYSRYMVFYNGRRLGSDHYRLVLPVRPTTPFASFQIYLAIPIETGDRLDVAYLPSNFKDVAMLDNIDLSGDIVVDKSKLGYNMSTDLYTFWVNGKKIPGSAIKDIDSTHVRLITDQKSTQSLCVTNHIPDLEMIIDAFTGNESLWDKIIAQFTDEQISELLGIESGEITNTEPHVYDKAINIRALMFELIREHYEMNPRVDTTDEFIYDYLDVDTVAVEEYGETGTASLPVSNANREDNLSDVIRPWP